MQPGGYEHRERRGIGIIFQLALLARHSETHFDIGVEGAGSCYESASDLMIFDRLGWCGSDRKAAAWQAVARD